MRIISGIYKGRILKSPSNKDDVRPTTDRARESLFNILTNRFDFNNKICLDLFCGTGSFGIEFISRGGKESIFVDVNIRTVRDNIENLKLYEHCKIFRDDAVIYLKSNVEKKIDIAFADPPYKFGNYSGLLEVASCFQMIFLLEHDKNFLVPGDFKNKLFLHKKIGVSEFSFFDFN